MSDRHDHEKPEQPLSDPPPLAETPAPGDQPPAGSKASEPAAAASRDEDSADQPDDQPDGEKKGLSLAAIRQKLSEDPKLLRGVIGGVVLVVLLVVVAVVWFGGGDDKSNRRRRAANRPTPPAGAPAQSEAPGDADGQDDADSGVDGDGTLGENDGSTEGDDGDTDGDTGDEQTGADQGDAEPEGPPPLPEDVAAWNGDDYFRARQEGSPRLIEAIGLLGEGFVGSESVAKGLAALLPKPEPAEPEETPEGGPARRTSHQQPANEIEVIAAIVNALAQNNTDTARAALQQVLSGEIELAEPQASVEAVLTALGEYPSPGNDDLLLAALIEPARFRPVDAQNAASTTPATSGGRPSSRRGTAAPMTAAWLQEQAHTVAEQHGSFGLRLKLARKLAQPTTPRVWREQFGGFLLEAEPNNLAAQFILYLAPDLQPERREQIETFFAACGSVALAEMLQLPASEQQRGRQQALQPAEALQCAGQLWGAKATGVFIERLGNLHTLDENPTLVNLCATMPVDPMRRALREMLRRHDDEGPAVFGARGSRETSLTDPALLLTIKSLPRDAPTATRGSRGGSRGQSGTWLEFSEKLVLGWCERLHEAAGRQAEAARLAGRRPRDAWHLDRLPFELHEGAKVKAAYFVAWPAMLPDAAAAARGLAPDRIGPTIVQYVRIEQRETPKRMEGYYRLKTRQRHGREISDGIWFDAYRVGSTSETRRSVDVLITGGGGQRGQSFDPSEEMDLVVELLVIEAGNPEG